MFTPKFLSRRRLTGVTQSNNALMVRYWFTLQVIFSSRSKLHSSLVLVKGSEREATHVMEATQLLINFMCESIAVSCLLFSFQRISLHWMFDSNYPPVTILGCCCCFGCYCFATSIMCLRPTTDFQFQTQIHVNLQLEISPHHHEVVKGKNNSNLLSIMDQTKTKVSNLSWLSIHRDSIVLEFLALNFQLSSVWV